VKIILGNANAEGQIHNDMMIQMKIHHHLKTTFELLDSIVLRLFVRLVVLLLPGQSLQDQNPQQIFLIFWVQLSDREFKA